ncbi:hypothetical protein F5X96DRAFT_286891 [Biscogniauxia mediterranea]|nr:hypothetical protein F5X96DRAFT_286891 [Biscogniauxia mediterranea]
MALDFPTIYLLPTHLEADELPELETQIPSLTYDIHEAKVILGKISKKTRALFELRTRGVLTDEVDVPHHPHVRDASPPAKRRRLSSPSQVPIDDDASTTSSHKSIDDDGMLVQVVKLAWFTDSVEKQTVLPVDDYLIYRGRKKQVMITHPMPSPQHISDNGDGDGDEDDKHLALPHRRSTATKSHMKVPPLLKETTSDHERAVALPPVPDYLHTAYSCQRPTRLNTPNDAFIDQLKKMRTIRSLENDQVGVRAYSTSIASIAAYPHRISEASEVARLPGCGVKIALLFRQWKSNGYLDNVKRADLDPKLSVLKLFYEIWGVAATTAHEFYNKGWRDLDDIVEYGWDKISREQQIGVKYYEELQEKIPREEVESIGKVVLDHANKLRRGYQMVIVGGYRRGKAASGDADIIISHPDPVATQYFIADIVCSLEKDKFITHTLKISNKNSDRGQVPVTWKGQDSKAGHGFDTLDKALVVWQNPVWDKSAATKNPNPHRRVDIIVSPWKTVGCAMVGWTGGTTFERDLRMYCKREKGLKFDSSGVRSRTNGGEFVDLESGPDGRPAPDMITAEKRVFEGLGLEWRPPEERCTR